MTAKVHTLAITSMPKINDQHADAGRWVGIEPPELPFTIADLVPQGMVTLLVSPGGAGKSLLMQMACTCIPTGLPFLGKATAGGNTASVFAEDPDAVLHRRQHRINRALDVEMDALVGRVFIRSYFGLDATLWCDEAPT